MAPFLLFFFHVESWATAHGWYRCAVYRLLSEPMSTRLLNSISSGICRQNTQFNMYTTTSKQQEGCTFKDSHPKWFITTNFTNSTAKLLPRAVNRGEILTAWRASVINKVKGNLVPRLLSTLPVPSRCERTLVLSGHVVRARLPYEVGVGRLINFVSKCFKIVTVLFH